MKTKLTFILLFLVTLTLSACGVNNDITLNNSRATIRLASIEDGLLPDFRVSNLRYKNPENLNQFIRNPRRGDRIIPVFTVTNTGEIANNVDLLIEDMSLPLGTGEDGRFEYRATISHINELQPNESRDFEGSLATYLHPYSGSHDWRVTADPYENIDEHNEYDNAFIFRTELEENDTNNPSKDFIASKQRLTPQNISRDGAHELNRGATGNFEVTVYDYDYIDGLSEDSTVIVDLMIDGNRIQRTDIQMEHGSGVLNYTINANDYSVGEHTVQIIVDPLLAIAEYNENNNTTEGKLLRIVEQGAVEAIPFADLEIADVQYSLYDNPDVIVPRESLQRGDIIISHVTVRNIGTAASGEFPVHIEDPSRFAGINNDGTIRPFISGMNFDNLEPGESQTKRSAGTFIIKGNGEKTLRFTADPYENISELNEGNNHFRSQIHFETPPLRQRSHDYLIEHVSRTPRNVVTMDHNWEINSRDAITLSIAVDDADFVDWGEPVIGEDVTVQIQVGDRVRTKVVNMNSAYTNVEFSFRGSELGLGLHPVTVSVNPGNALPESNTRNNTRTTNSILVLENGAADTSDIARPDMVIENITLKRLNNGEWEAVNVEDLHRGDLFKPYITLRNVGLADSGRFTVFIEDHSTTGRNPITGQMGPGINGVSFANIPMGAASTETTRPYLIDANGTGDYIMRFRIDGHEVVQESNEDNNFFAYHIPREGLGNNINYDLIPESAIRVPDNITQDEAWQINTSETLRLAISIRNNDYVDSDYQDYSLNHIPVELRVGDNYTSVLFFDLPDYTNRATQIVEIPGSRFIPGTYYVRAIVDQAGYTTETNELNNDSGDRFHNVTVTETPIAANLKSTNARLVEIDPTHYYPIITITNDSDIPVNHSFNTIISNKANELGFDHNGDFRYQKVNARINSLGAHESTELTLQDLPIEINERARNKDVYVRIDNTGYSTIDEVDESNETDNEGSYNIGAMLDELAPLRDNDIQVPEELQEDEAQPAVEPEPQVDEAPQPAVEEEPQFDEAPQPAVEDNENDTHQQVTPVQKESQPDVTLDIKPKNGDYKLNGKYDNKKYTGFVTVKAYVNDKEAAKTYAYNGTYKVTLKKALKDGDKLQIEVIANSGKLKGKSELTTIASDKKTPTITTKKKTPTTKTLTTKKTPTKTITAKETISLSPTPTKGSKALKGTYDKKTYTGTSTIKAYINGKEVGRTSSSKGTFSIKLKKALNSKDKLEIKLFDKKGKLKTKSSTYTIK